MTETLPQPYELPQAAADAPIRLPAVVLPPKPSARARLALAGLVLLGYAYVLGVLGVFAFGLVALAAAGAIWALFVVGAVFVVVLPALRVRVSSPEGVRLTKRTAPGLLDVVERQRRRVGARRPTVLLVDGAEAFVVEVPRLGILGWNRVYLVLGLPFLLSLSPEELEFLVAHELAHVARGHLGRSVGVGGSLARWRQLEARLDERQHWSGRLFRPFLRWYLPRLEHASLALSRRREYEADRAAAAVTGAEVAATSLARSALVHRHLDEELWNDVLRRADDEPRPPAPFSLMRTAARQELRHAHARLAEVVRHADSDWTHPSLAQRLTAIGVTTVEPRRLKPPAASAADVYLDGALHDLLADFDEQWRSWVADAWSERHEEAKDLREELAALESGSDDSPEARRRRAVLVARFDGAVAARRLWERVLHDDDADAVAHYWVGRAQLESGDERGLDSLLRAVELDAHATPEAAEAAADFLVDARRPSDVDAWRERMSGYAARVAAAHEERSRLRPMDELEPHGLSAEVVEVIRAELTGVRGIRTVYLARKRCVEFSDEPLWVVGIRRRPRRFRLQRQRHLNRVVRAVAERVEPILADSCWVVLVEGFYAPLEPKFGALPDSCVLGRPPRTLRLHRRAGVRSVAVAAVVVCVAILGLVRLLDGETGAAAPIEPSVESVDAPTGELAWAARANAGCVTILGLGGSREPRARLALEREFVEVLAAEAIGPGAPVAVGLAQRRVAALERVVALQAAGRTQAAQRELRRLDADESARRALTALGAPDCAAP